MFDKCPQCGSEISDKSSQICNHCGSTIVTVGSKFVMTKKQNIGQL